MLISKNPLFTLKKIDNYHDYQANYQFMLSSGLIRKISSGIYLWLPRGLIILEKIKTLIRNEMTNLGAIEIMLPILQPSCYLKESGRLNLFGKDLFTLLDRNHHTYILSPTNEEIITNLIHQENLAKYNFPINIYQFQTKFRDEIRPRYGIIRTREFIMKDAYSFHLHKKCFLNTYNHITHLYEKIFSLLQLKTIKVNAYAGNIGGHYSHEFHILTKHGEDELAITNNYSYAVNREIAIPFINYKNHNNNFKQSLKLIDKYTLQTINNKNYNLNNNFIKTILLQSIIKNKFILLLLPYNRMLNINNLNKYKAYIQFPIKYINIQEYQTQTKHYINLTNIYFLGPIGLKQILLVILDNTLINNDNFIIGSNFDNFFLTGVNLVRDILFDKKFDNIIMVNSGDLSPNQNQIIQIKKSLEIAHIFSLGTKYTSNYLNIKNLIMGCYGIGLTRLLAAIIEQHSNHYTSIIWPNTITPFKILILPIDMYHSTKVLKTTYKIYQKLIFLKIEVLLDDRHVTPGIMFRDMELLGISHILIISNKNLLTQQIEYLNRKTNEKHMINKNNVINFILHKLKF